MEQEIAKNSRVEEETASESSEGKEEYIPRNAVVRAKESLYSRVNVSVREVNLFIGGCCALIVFLVAMGMMMQ